MGTHEPLPLFGVLVPLLPRLLRLRLLGCPSEVKAMGFLENCVALESLDLIYTDDFTRDNIRLPLTLKNLHVHFTSRQEFQDENLLKTITGAKHIRKLLITAAHQTPGQAENQDALEEEEARPTFTETNKFCSEHNIIFDCDDDFRLPAFFSEV